MGISLKLQKRLAASVLNCGVRKVWMDPNECNEISMANSRACPCRRRVWQRRRRGGQARHCSVKLGFLACAPRHAAACRCQPWLTRATAPSRSGQNIRKLVKDGFVIRKPEKARH